MSTTRRPPRVRSLVLAWAAYWALLVAVVLGPAAALLLRLSGEGSHGDVTASLGSDGVALAITARGAPAWALHASAPEIAFWLAVPPLVILVAWLMLGHGARREAALDRAASGGLRPGDDDDPRLAAPAQDFTAGSARERVHERRREPR